MLSTHIGVELARHVIRLGGEEGLKNVYAVVRGRFFGRPGGASPGGHMRVELGGEEGVFSWREMDDVLSSVFGLSCDPGIVVRLLSLGCLVTVSASCVTRAIQTVGFALSCCMLDIIVSCSVPI